jgi:hypothetical protein
MVPHEMCKLIRRRLEKLGKGGRQHEMMIVAPSVADSYPDPQDPYVFGPPGSRFRIHYCSQMYGSGSGSGSFYHQAKIVRKTLILQLSTFLLTFYLLKMM